MSFFEYDEGEDVLKFLDKYLFDPLNVDRSVIEKLEAVNTIIEQASIFCDKVDTGIAKSKRTYPEFDKALKVLGVRE